MGRNERHRRTFERKRGCVMKEVVERVMKAFSQKHQAMTPEQERKVRDEVSEFVAELLEKRAAQLTKFADRRLRETEPRI